MWYFKFYIVSTSYIINYIDEIVLFEFENINNCIILSIVIKERFCYTEVMTSEIDHSENKFSKWSMNEDELLRHSFAIHVFNNFITKKKYF